MHPTSIFALLATTSLVVANPIDYGFEERGLLSSSSGYTCSGDIIGYRTVSTDAIAKKVNSTKAFPKDPPNGVDLGGNSVYFSDGFGDYAGGGSGVNWCVAYADTTKLKAANKVWFPKTSSPLEKCTRGSDNNVDAWISLLSAGKFTAETTLRFADMSTYLQMAIPFSMLDTMKVCGMCFPKADAQAKKSQYPRIAWETNAAYTGTNTKQSVKRDGLEERSTPSTCPLPASL